MYLLGQCCSQFLSVYDAHKQTLHKLKTLADLGTQELKEVWPSVQTVMCDKWLGRRGKLKVSTEMKM